METKTNDDATTAIISRHDDIDVAVVGVVFVLTAVAVAVVPIGILRRRSSEIAVLLLTESAETLFFAMVQYFII